MPIEITGFYTALLAILFVYLSILVAQHRLKNRVSMGDGGDPHFQTFIRAQANFAEYVPLILLLMLTAELNGADPLLVHGMGTSLLIARLLHAYGLIKHLGPSWQRLWGVLLTFSSLLFGAVVNLILFY